MRFIQITNLSRKVTPVIVKNCDTFFSRLHGLMFVPALAPNEGILIDEKLDSRMNTSIHMLFMNFDITAVWINSQNQIVDVKLAKRWALAYTPLKPARYILEIGASRILDFQIGDQVSYSNVE